MPQPTPRWLDADQQRSWRALVMGTTLLFSQLEEELRRDFDVSMTEYEILVRLSEAEGRRLRMSQLAGALGHSRSRVTHTVDRMEQAGLLERVTSSEDGRGVLATMTPRGYALLVKMAPRHVAGVREHLVDLVGAADFAALGRVMDAVSDHLVAERPDIELR